MRYVVSVKHNVSGLKTGFNLELVGSVEGVINSAWLNKLKEIMETDFIGFHITKIMFEEM